MNATMQKLDPKIMLQSWLNGLVAMYSSDVNPIPDDKWSTGMGGCTRSAGDLTGDAIALLEWTNMALQGNIPDQSQYEPYMAQLKQQCSTKEGAIARLKSASEGFNQSLGNASEESLLKTVMAPWGMETPLWMVAQAAVSHVWYHDGQLNYIHCLLGDNKVYWMGD